MAAQQQQKRVRFQNLSGETVPAYSVMYVTDIKRDDVTKEFYYQIIKVDSESMLNQDPNKILFNQHTSIDDQRWGWASYGLLCAASIGDDVDDINIGDSFGIVEDSWDLWKGGGICALNYFQELTDDDTGDTYVYGYIQPPTSNGLMVEWEDTIDGASSSSGAPYETEYISANVLKWSAVDLDNPDDQELEYVQDGEGTNMQVRIYHAGTEAVDAGIGKATLIGGRWILDLAYCSS